MPLRPCLACNESVSDRAGACPHCGEPSTLRVWLSVAAASPFLVWQTLALAMAVRVSRSFEGLSPANGPLEEMGQAVGLSLGLHSALFVWTAGSIATGFFALIARPR